MGKANKTGSGKEIKRQNKARDKKEHQNNLKNVFSYLFMNIWMARNLFVSCSNFGNGR